MFVVYKYIVSGFASAAFENNMLYNYW